MQISNRIELKRQRESSVIKQKSDKIEVGSTMKSTLSKKETILALGHCDTYFPGPNPISIAKIFAENRWRLLVDYELYRKGIRLAIMKAVNSIILCEYHDLGHTLYECPHCETSLLFGILVNLVFVISGV